MPKILGPFRFVLIAVAGVVEPTPTADHRLPSRGESGSSRVNSAGGECGPTTTSAAVD